jgi:anti-sigma B factor antagonist
MSMDPAAFSVSDVDGDGRVVVVPRGELDLATAPDLEAVLRARLDDGRRVVVDLRELAFMDSTGLRVLVAAHARAGDGRFAIVRPPAGSPVAKLLAIAGVEQQLEVLDEL